MVGVRRDRTPRRLSSICSCRPPDTRGKRLRVDRSERPRRRERPDAEDRGQRSPHEPGRQTEPASAIHDPYVVLASGQPSSYTPSVARLESLTLEIADSESGDARPPLAARRTGSTGPPGARALP